MSRMPDYDYCALTWATFYPRDWLTDTRNLQVAERGLFIDILCAIYNAGGPIEHDEDYLCRLGGYKNVRSLRRELTPLLDKKKLHKLSDADGGDWLMNNRAEEEIEKARIRRDKNKDRTEAAHSSTQTGDKKGDESVKKAKSGKKGVKKSRKSSKKMSEHSDNTVQNQGDNLDIPQPPPAPRTDSSVPPLQGGDGKSPSPPVAAALPDGAPLTAEQLNMSRAWLWARVVACLGKGVNGEADAVKRGWTAEVPAIDERGLNAWVLPLRLQRIEAGVWHVGAPTRLIRDHVQSAYAAAIEAAINAVMVFYKPRNEHVDGQNDGQNDGQMDRQGGMSDTWVLALHVGV